VVTVTFFGITDIKVTLKHGKVSGVVETSHNISISVGYTSSLILSEVSLQLS
jgi:hypothetical protein